MKTTISITARTNGLAITFAYGGGVAFIILALSFLITAQDEGASDPIFIASTLTFSAMTCMIGIVMKLTANCLKKDFMRTLDKASMDVRRRAYQVPAIIIVEDRTIKSVILKQDFTEIGYKGILPEDSILLVGDLPKESELTADIADTEKN
jgi:hypothetical protein